MVEVVAVRKMMVLKLLKVRRHRKVKLKSNNKNELHLQTLHYINHSKIKSYGE